MRNFGVLISIFILTILSSCKKEDPEGITRCFIFTGQSNMAGKGIVSELSEEYLAKDDRIKILHNYEIKPFKPSGTTFGPEVGFAHEMLKLYPRDTILIVKMAKGGASILCYDEHWIPDTATKYDFIRQGNMYDSLLAYIGTAKALVKNMKIEGVLYLQGERDTEESQLSIPYKSRFYQFIDNYRRDLKMPMLSFFVASYRNDGLTANIDETPQYQVAVPLKYNVYQTHYLSQFDKPFTFFIPLYDLLDHRADGFDDGHYNTSGQLELGKLYAQKYHESRP